MGTGNDWGQGQKRRTWQGYVALAEHYLAIGWSKVGLDLLEAADPGDNLPWELVSEAEFRPYQYQDATVFFAAAHESGLVFSWALHLVSPYHGDRPAELQEQATRTAVARLPARFLPVLERAILHQHERCGTKHKELDELVQRTWADRRRLQALATLIRDTKEQHTV
jgi:hypothetical protein